MRKSTSALAFFAVLLMLLGLSFLDAEIRLQEVNLQLDRRAGLVRELGLSDLALFTEARFTRHLSLADLHAPFQDHPTSFDHFPSTSLVLPPEHLRR